MKATLSTACMTPRRKRSRPQLHEPTDAIVRVVRAAICGSDLWPYGSAQPM